MTGYESKRAAAQAKLDDDDTQVYQDHPAQEPVATLFGTLPVYDTTPPQPTEQEHVATEPAPPNSLPSWGECAMRVGNSDFIAKRVAEGGYGAEGDSMLANALHRFIYEYDDKDPYRSAWFLHRLEQVITEYTAPPQRTVQVSPLEFVEMVMDKEHLVGTPIVWAQWPNKEKNS